MIRTSGQDDYDAVAGSADPGVLLTIGVTHSPEPRVLERMATDGCGLILAGHTHGGQLRVPLYGALVTNCGSTAARARGLSRYDGTWLHVSAGLGHVPDSPGSVRLPARGDAAHARGHALRFGFTVVGGPAGRRLDSCRVQVPSGCSAAWQRAAFGTQRPWVQIPPPRPCRPCLAHPIQSTLALAGQALGQSVVSLVPPQFTREAGRRGVGVDADQFDVGHHGKVLECIGTYRGAQSSVVRTAGGQP